MLIIIPLFFGYSSGPLFRVWSAEGLFGRAGLCDGDIDVYIDGGHS